MDEPEEEVEGKETPDSDIVIDEEDEEEDKVVTSAIPRRRRLEGTAVTVIENDLLVNLRAFKSGKREGKSGMYNNDTSTRLLARRVNSGAIVASLTKSPSESVELSNDPTGE